MPSETLSLSAVTNHSPKTADIRAWCRGHSTEATAAARPLGVVVHERVRGTGSDFVSNGLVELVRRLKLTSAALPHHAAPEKLADHRVRDVFRDRIRDRASRQDLTDASHA